jgi:hypothetical protein
MIDFDLEFYDPELSYMDNRLFCTFSTADTLESTLSDIQNRHTILYNKMFVLYSKNEDEFAITYNVDLGNVSDFLPGAILVHIKKETKSLFFYSSFYFFQVLQVLLASDVLMVY